MGLYFAPAPGAKFLNKLLMVPTEHDSLSGGRKVN